MLPRPYQFEGVDRAFVAWLEEKKILGVAATGMGKTVLFSLIMERFFQQSTKRALVIAHREELITQAANKIHDVTGAEAEIEMAECRASHATFSRSRVVVASVQTLSRRKRLARFDPNDYGLVIIDEAHHAIADQYLTVINHFASNPETLFLGVTATPKRADKKALGQVFKSVAWEYDLRYGIDNGWLVRLVPHVVPVDGLDISMVGTVAGDLNAGELSEQLILERPLLQMAAASIEICCGMPNGTIKELMESKAIDELPHRIVEPRKTLIFTASVEHAERFCEILNRFLPNSARWVSGETPREERRQLWKDYASQKFQFLVNCGVATEGFDDPGIQVVVMARMTKSPTLFCQIIGRGTRPLPGVVDDPDDFPFPAQRIAKLAASAKPSVEIVDFKGNFGRHRLVRITDILGGKYEPEVVDRAHRIIEQEGKLDADVALERAAREVQQDREKARAEREAEEARAAARRAALVGTTKYTKNQVDPFEVLNIAPAREEGDDAERPITPGQAAFLEENGINTNGMSFKRAKQLQFAVHDRRRRGLCSFGQAKILSKRGMPTNVSAKEASRQIDEIAQREGWKPREKPVRRAITAPSAERY